MSYSQLLNVNEAEKLTKDLNTFLVDSIHLSFNTNEGLLVFDNISKRLDLRDTAEIARDSMSEKEIKTAFYTSGRYTGNVFWKYDFEAITSSKASLRVNKYGKLFLKLPFQEKDTIFLESRLNAYTSHHKITDSQLHQVTWSGEKYISILLQPERVTNHIRFSVKGITISGKIEREDELIINENYSKTLRSILKREFQKIFDELTLKLSTTKGTIRLSETASQ